MTDRKKTDMLEEIAMTKEFEKIEKEELKNSKEELKNLKNVR